MYKQIDSEKESVNNITDTDKISVAIQNVTNYDAEIKGLLSRTINVLERISRRKAEMDTLFNSLSSNNKNLNENAKRYMNDSAEIINQLNSHVQKITKLKTYANEVIEQLQKELTRLLDQRKIEIPVDDTQTSLSTEDVKKETANQKELETDKQKELEKAIEKEQEEAVEGELQKTIEVEKESAIKEEQETPEQEERETSINQEPEHVTYETLGYDTPHAQENESDGTQHDDSERDDKSKAKDAMGRTRLAGAIIIGLSFFPGVLVLAFRDTQTEEEESHEHDYHQAFGGTDDYNMQDKEEVIEVCFNEDD